MRVSRGRIWELRLLSDAQFHCCSFVRLTRRGPWHRIANWQAEELVRRGIARWVADGRPGPAEPEGTAEKSQKRQAVFVWN